MDTSGVSRPTVLIETLGCKLNLADSELLNREFELAGFTQAAIGDPVDVFVLNTCSVTHVADRKARQRLRSARREHPGAYIVATGCYPARAATEVAALPEVDLVADNAAKRGLARRVAMALGWPASGLPVFEMTSDLPPRAHIPARHTRAFVKIQEGCNDYCSYCIIPKTRGRSETLAEEAILEVIREREAEGFVEIVLTGTQLGDYGIALPGSRRRGPDLQDQRSAGDPLARLLRRILDSTSVPRIRMSSIQPQDVTDALLDLWRDPRLCPHFHLPLQSGSGRVLRLMRRRYTPEQFLGAVARIRDLIPSVSITTDVIAGFPGETEDDFAETLRVAEAAQFADIHAFPYSPRPGTLATRLPDPVREPVKQRRLHALLELASRSRDACRLRAVGQVRPVLWEERKTLSAGSEPVWLGLTDNYLRVLTASKEDLHGTVSSARLLRPEGPGLLAEVVG